MENRARALVVCRLYFSCLVPADVSTRFDRASSGNLCTRASLCGSVNSDALGIVSLGSPGRRFIECCPSSAPLRPPHEAIDRRRCTAGELIGLWILELSGRLAIGNHSDIVAPPSRSAPACSRCCGLRRSYAEYRSPMSPHLRLRRREGSRKLLFYQFA